MSTARIVSAHELIDLTLDSGSFESWDAPPSPLMIEESYRDELLRARERSGVAEAILTGEGTLDSRRVAIIVGEFAFLGGSIGVNAASRIVAALDRATAERLPVLAAPVSGGTRMQEGTRAFLQMVKIASAVARHKASGLPYLVYLRHPTTGGVFASWGSLGHVTVAQSGALIGFLGPKVYEALRGEPFPEGVQTAENLYRHGIVDAVLDPARLRQVARDALEVIESKAPPRVERWVPPELPPAVSAWESIAICRHPQRPGLRSLLHYGASTNVSLSGTAEGESNRNTAVSLSVFGGHGTVVVGLDRRAHDGHGELGPDALRQARRGMALAEELGLPLIAVVDTPGAALSRAAEEGGLGGQIARCLSELSMLRVPTVSVLLGEGTGGGALALLPADRLIAAQNGWLAPLPPEGASLIRFGDTAHAPEMAADQRVRATDLAADGIVDEIIPEYPTADAEAEAFCVRVSEAIVRHLDELVRSTADERLSARRQRFDQLASGLAVDHLEQQSTTR